MTKNKLPPDIEKRFVKWFYSKDEEMVEWGEEGRYSEKGEGPFYDVKMYDDPNFIEVKFKQFLADVLKEERERIFKDIEELEDGKFPSIILRKLKQKYS